MFDDLAAPEAGVALDRLRVTTIAAPVVALDRVYRAWQGDDALLWDPPSGLQAVAAGAAVRLRASGSRRMAQVLEASRRLWHSLRTAPAGATPLPRLWGGFAFAPGAAAYEPWRDFGDAHFVLPRLAYWRSADKAWLQAVGVDGEARDLAAASALLARAPDADHEDERADRAPTCTITPPDAAAWQQQIDDILEAIEAGQARKVVAALCAHITFSQPPPVTRVLANLRSETGPVWRFAVGHNGATFVGATPELLVRRHGALVESEALAGTLAKASGSGADLLASAKDRREHGFVRDAIVETLAPLCRELQLPDAPVVRELKRLFHLATPIRGQLAGERHVLDLCERLHPTPATGGTPSKRALEIILTTEPTPRGWYAAPLGWFDAAGDGEFVVGLRSGLLTRNAAYVHAGAGIVAGSRADRELAETQLKQRVLLRALGLEPRSADA